jgi:catechol 2,3-dioxygenase-like lactoylglutathione lyase family enzyme
MDLNQVTLRSNNIRDSIEFYSNMGFKLIVKNNNYARFECPKGDSTFSIHLTNEKISSGTVIYFEVNDVVKTVSELKEKGYEFTQDPKEETWLWHESRINDPSGNIVCIYTAGENRKNPPWRES